MRKRRSSPPDPPPRTVAFTVEVLISFLPRGPDGTKRATPQMIEDRRSSWGRGIDGFGGDLEAVRAVLTKAVMQEWRHSLEPSIKEYWERWASRDRPVLEYLHRNPHLLGLFAYDDRTGEIYPRIQERLSELVKDKNPTKREAHRPARPWVKEANKKLLELGIRSKRKREFLLYAIGLRD